jgi:hypothetical protein
MQIYHEYPWIGDTGWLYGKPTVLKSALYYYNSMAQPGRVTAGHSAQTRRMMKKRRALINRRLAARPERLAYLIEPVKAARERIRHLPPLKRV